MSKPVDMTQHTNQTAPTQYVEAKGIRFAYRRYDQHPDPVKCLRRLNRQTSSITAKESGGKTAS